MQSSYIIPIFLPYMGCPFRCIYCSVDRVCPGVVKPDEIEEYVNRWLSLFINGGKNNENRRVEIAFYGGTFTNIPLKLRNAYLEKAVKFVENKKVYGIRISTRPDFVDEDTIEYLKRMHVKVIEIGVESFDDEVLMKSKRGYDSKVAFNGCARVKKNNIELGIHLMVGLPGDDMSKCMKTMKRTIDLKPDHVRIHPTLILKNTEIERMYERGRYSPLKLDEALDIVSEMFIGFSVYDIKVSRMGFFIPKDKYSEIIAGPFHPSFGDMVKYHVFGKIVKWSVKRYTVSKIIMGWKNISLINGYDGKNKDILSNYKLLKHVELTNDNRIEFEIDGTRTDYRTLMEKYFKEGHNLLTQID